MFVFKLKLYLKEWKLESGVDEALERENGSHGDDQRSQQSREDGVEEQVETVSGFNQTPFAVDEGVDEGMQQQLRTR